MGVGDLIGTTAASVDLLSGELLEVSTYYPNGARETLRTNAGIAVPLEPMGFTGKEADEDVGLVYFGERYLLARLGRWASPDPLHVHASGGGEALNSYHYVSGNLLQGRDPLGLSSTAYSSEGVQAGWEASDQLDADGSIAGYTFRQAPDALSAAGSEALATAVDIGAEYSRDPEGVSERALVGAVNAGEVALAGGAVVAITGAGLAPGVGEAMDAYTLVDPEASTADRALAAASLWVGLESAGVMPNLGPVRLARRAVEGIAEGSRALRAGISDLVHAVPSGGAPAVALPGGSSGGGDAMAMMADGPPSSGPHTGGSMGGGDFGRSGGRNFSRYSSHAGSESLTRHGFPTDPASRANLLDEIIEGATTSIEQADGATAYVRRVGRGGSARYDIVVLGGAGGDEVVTGMLRMRASDARSIARNNGWSHNPF